MLSLKLLPLPAAQAKLRFSLTPPAGCMVVTLWGTFTHMPVTLRVLAMASARPRDQAAVHTVDEVRIEWRSTTKPRAAPQSTLMRKRVLPQQLG
jgi:hypothetical protein